MTMAILPAALAARMSATDVCDADIVLARAIDLEPVADDLHRGAEILDRAHRRQQRVDAAGDDVGRRRPRPRGSSSGAAASSRMVSLTVGESVTHDSLPSCVVAPPPASDPAIFGRHGRLGSPASSAHLRPGPAASTGGWPTACRCSAASGSADGRHSPAGLRARSGGRPSIGRQALVEPRVDARHGLQQRGRVGMLRALEDLERWPRLDEPSGIHHQHARAETRDQRDIVGDQDDGGAGFLVHLARAGP